MADRPRPPPEGQLRWRVGESGNTVIVEFDCHDAYQAIELFEVIFAGLSDGYLEIETGPERSGTDKERG